MGRYSVVDVLREVEEKKCSIINILKEILVPGLADHFELVGSF